MASLGKSKKVLTSPGKKANRGRKPGMGKPLSDFKRNTLRKLFGK